MITVEFSFILILADIWSGDSGGLALEGITKFEQIHIISLKVSYHNSIESPTVTYHVSLSESTPVAALSFGFGAVCVFISDQQLVSLL